MLVTLSLALGAVAAVSATPTGPLQRREDQVIAGQLYPESCMSDCQPWLDLQLPCVDAEDQASCMCVRDNTLKLYSCSACVVNAQGYSKTVADTMYSIVRVHDSTCDALSASLNPPTSTAPLVVGGTTYLGLQPSDVVGKNPAMPTLYWINNGTTAQSPAGGKWPARFSTIVLSSSSSTTTPGPSAIATVIGTSSSSSSSASAASSSTTSPSATAAGLSASESAPPSNGASPLCVASGLAALGVGAAMALLS
ncbi:hypothetical protein JCM6882_009211 [Rhodosporidiobolus microsporus]